MQDYEKLLDKGYKELPDTITDKERFDVEAIKGHLEGNKTVLANFKKIAKFLHRDPDHMLKYILRELASPGKFAGERTILGIKTSASKINKKIKQYVSEFVLCPACGKPDTKLQKEREITYIKCMACGAKHPVKNI